MPSIWPRAVLSRRVDRSMVCHHGAVLVSGRGATCGSVTRRSPKGRGTSRRRPRTAGSEQLGGRRPRLHSTSTVWVSWSASASVTPATFSSCRLHRRVAVAAHKAFGLDDVLHGVVLSIKGVMPRVYRGACQRCMPRKRRGRVVAYSRVRIPRCYSLALNPRKRRALPTTHSDERLIAAAPNMGESCHPKMGKKTPAASGMPREL